MTRRRVLGRRTFLRGAAGTAIALPFLDEMRPSVVSASDEPPVRLFTGFFGNGLLPPVFENDDPLAASGALSPLRRHLSKLAILRGIDMNTPTGHPQGGGATFVGFVGTSGQQGGPSIDVVARNELHPEGVPTPIRTMLVASYFRRDNVYRGIHSWNEDGSPMDLPVERPSALFERLFGSVEVPDADPAAFRRLRQRRSVLDAVIADYRYAQSERAGLSAPSRARIADHLERIRDIERRIFPEELGGAPPGSCFNPEVPTDPPIPYATEADVSGVEVDHVAWADTQALLGDLVAIALRCDLTRFGNITYQASGERVRFSGDYDYNGTTVRFDDQSAHHQLWHSEVFPQVEWHIHYIMARFARLLDALDDPEYPEENGKTLLDNMTFLLGAELGNGSTHDTKNTFHAVSSGNGRFRVGGLVDVNQSSVTVYNTILSALGVTRAMGDQTHHDPGAIDSLLLR